MPIYAAFDADDQCLYVGETSREHPIFRWAEHVRNGAPWVDDAVRWEVVKAISERSAHDRLQPLHGSREATVTKPTCASGSNVAPPPVWTSADRALDRFITYLTERGIEEGWGATFYDRVLGLIQDFRAAEDEPIELG
jgi:hypothetical protein